MQERITFRATATLKAALKAEAKRDKRKLSNLVVLLLEEALRSRGMTPEQRRMNDALVAAAHQPKEQATA